MACRPIRRNWRWPGAWPQYGSLRMKRIAALPAHKAALAKLAFVGLQHHQRHALGSGRSTALWRRSSSRRRGTWILR